MVVKMRKIICSTIAIISLSSATHAFTSAPSTSLSIAKPAAHSSVPQFPFKTCSSPTFLQSSKFQSKTLLHLSSSDKSQEENKLPMLLDPGTKGGALFLSLVLFIFPLIVYNIVTIGFGVDETEAGRDIGVGFTVITCLAWASTYIFRVATKDMTYVSK